MIEYQSIHEGEKLRAGDEYSTGGWVWRVVPDFMINSIIPNDSHTLWRRQLGKISSSKTFKEKLFSLFFK